ncbi:threonine--tRNA ligase [Populus alba x Populus x berolinensis]|nr:threonine--tRNA ligase [Populus alba x Populus x berolinensis]
MSMNLTVKASFTKGGTGVLERPTFDQSQFDPSSQALEGGDIGRLRDKRGVGSGDSDRVLLIDDVLPQAVPSVKPDDARKLFHESRENGVAEHAEFYSQIMVHGGLRSIIEPESNSVEQYAKPKTDYKPRTKPSWSRNLRWRELHGPLLAPHARSHNRNALQNPPVQNRKLPHAMCVCPRLLSPLRRFLPSSSLLLAKPPRRLLSSFPSSTTMAASYSNKKDEGYLNTVIPKRIQLFQSIQSEQLSRIQSLPHDSIKITLPDGTVKEGKRWQSSPMDIAKEIGKMTKDATPFGIQALEMEYGCKLCIGPCTTRGEGFYYDAYYGELGLNDNHFKQIDAAALKAVAVEIIKDLPPDKTITVYRCGPLVDLCRGPHIPNTSCASSAYWRGNRDRESLQRVYGISFPDKKTFAGVQAFLGRSKESGKLVFFLPHGTRVYNKLMEFIKNEYRRRGYEEVKSPNIYNMKLWETSGHAANYKENMFLLEIEKQEFGLKTMNCPGHCLMFQHRNFLFDFADFGVLHRNEVSGALTGLTRVRRFQQDDAHIFCRKSQIKAEVRGVLEFIDYAYGKFGFTYELKLSTRPEKYLGAMETWEEAEKDLAEALNEFGKPWKFNEGDGAFYGPKIDISVSDALKRKFQCATLQLTFQLPDRFKLEYSAEDEAKSETPVMIHRAILGSVERMYAILLEHYKGKWPFWLSPRQAIVCPDQIHEAGYFVDADTTDRKIQKKVREAQLAQYNYILVVGEEEAKTGQVIQMIY